MNLSIIHLTDIHMNADISKNPILSRKEELYKACYSVLGPCDDAIIVISGDIAFSGKTEEYDNAYELIDYIQQKLEKHLNCDLKVLMVPGNHDCNFSVAEGPRERLLKTVEFLPKIDLETLRIVTSVQDNFFEFSEFFSKYDSSNICNVSEVKCGAKKILFQLMNSAWMSQKNEQPSSIFIPQDTLKGIPADDYDCVFTVMHHPYNNWLQPNNSIDFINWVRQTTDALLIGHEHRKDSFTSQSENWSISEFRGKELQGCESSESAFSIYQFDEGFQNVTTFDFVWDNGIYKRKPETSRTFTRNTLISSFMLTPSKEYMNEFIDDPGTIIIHENADNVRLSEIYCWPDLEIIEGQDSTAIVGNDRITNDIPSQLLASSISVVVGDSLSGKTSLAKMLFKEYYQREECCILIDGEKLHKVHEDKLRARIDEIYVEEYSEESLEKYRQLPPEKRIFIIDDFNNIPYHDERRAKVLSFLGQFASNVIVFIDDEMEARLICSKLTLPINTAINYYKICNFGNSKRHEFIKKWHCLRDEYANGNREVEERITNSFERINLLLGTSNGFIPATPIYLINLLQNMDAIVPASYNGSQYGYLYDSLINKSLSVIKHINQGTLNIYINVMSTLAFDMLQKGSNTFTELELLNNIKKFSARKKVTVNSGDLVKYMLKSRLIQEKASNTYKFRYPYAFYYFAGRYIAYHLDDPEVEAQIDFMSQRLYHEKYGDIIIFVCHFANNKKIIENILLVAYTSLEKYNMFDFDKHLEIFERAKNIMDSIFAESIVGTENDVENNCQNEREIKDKMGIQDGTVQELANAPDEEDERKNELASLSAAMRTLDVLGQIIMNYPGDIDGDDKIAIIDEIHNLGMRITEALLSAIGLLEKGFIEYIVEYVREQKPGSNTPEIIEATQTIFSWLVARMTCGMIRKISMSLRNDALLIAVEETFSGTTSISQKLILADLQFNILRKPDIDKAQQLAIELDKSSSTKFAGAVLRSIVSDYLKHNKCGYSIRDQLCNHFQLSDKKMLLEEAKNREIC